MIINRGPKLVGCLENNLKKQLEKCGNSQGVVELDGFKSAGLNRGAFLTRERLM